MIKHRFLQKFYREIYNYGKKGVLPIDSDRAEILFERFLENFYLELAETDYRLPRKSVFLYLDEWITRLALGVCLSLTIHTKL